MKKPTKKQLKNLASKAATTGAIVALVAVGWHVGTTYNRFIDNVKSDGVTEFVLRSCEEYTNKEKTQLWLECEPMRQEGR